MFEIQNMNEKRYVWTHFEDVENWFSDTKTTTTDEVDELNDVIDLHRLDFHTTAGQTEFVSKLVPRHQLFHYLLGQSHVSLQLIRSKTTSVFLLTTECKYS